MVLFKDLIVPHAVLMSPAFFLSRMFVNVLKQAAIRPYNKATEPYSHCADCTIIMHQNIYLYLLNQMFLVIQLVTPRLH
jgi:hypothetical protein